MSSDDLDIVRPRVGGAVIVCLSFRPVRGHASLRGWCDLQIPSWRLRLHDCGVFSKDGKNWIALPSKVQLGRDGQPLTDDAGKAKYSASVSFDNSETLARFVAAATQAVLDYRPDAFGEVRP